MPKKRTGKALLIKPGSQSTIASSSNNPTAQHESTPSVNDLIRESRRMQARDQSVSSTPPVQSSVPPQVRQALNLPTPEPPRPRPGGARVLRRLPVPSSERGSGRTRITPGPPPPRSWLTGSRHAPPGVLEGRSQALRTLEANTRLPGGNFPVVGTLVDYTLKELAVNWNWHVENTLSDYFALIPVRLREVLLSYIAFHHQNPAPLHNPLQTLFLDDAYGPEDHRSVTRLDLEGALGSWTDLKTLERGLSRPAFVPAMIAGTTKDVPESWDQDSSSDSPLSSIEGLSRTFIFPRLEHLSLALSPTAESQPPLWKSLLRLADHLPALRSLSLANWPYPTYTPHAARTRATISAGTSGSFPPVVYGGTNMYSTLDEDWREAAGILRSLSRKLPSLTWLDLSGCGVWWEALVWHQLENVRPPVIEDDIYVLNESSSSQQYVPEWNGAWRGLTTIVLRIGWTPVKNHEVVDHTQHDMSFENFVELGKKVAYSEDQREHERLRLLQRKIESTIRAVRRQAHGAWIDFGL
jgi:hypothetical protein